RRCDGASHSVADLWRARSAERVSKRQWSTVRHHWPGWPLELVRLVAQARDPTRAHRARKTAAERAPRAHAPDAQTRGRDASGTDARRTATPLPPPPQAILLSTTSQTP